MFARYCPLALAPLFFFACEEDGTTTPKETQDYAPCMAAERVGGFSVVLDDGYTAVDGRVASGVVPSSIRDETASAGGCRLVEGRSLSCTPACSSDQTCDVGNVCIPYPTAASVGVVTVDGLTAPLSMSPTSVGSYTNGATTLPHPAASVGSVVTLTAPGDVLPGFTLTTRGVEAIAVDQTGVALVRDQAFVVTWTPGTESSARVRMVLDLAHHGSVAASLDCDGLDDDGNFEVPASMVTRLIDIGVAGFPTLTVTRRTAAKTAIEQGCVDLTVQSSVVLPVTVDGVTSCVEDEECDNGETCQGDLTCG